MLPKNWAGQWVPILGLLEGNLAASHYLYQIRLSLDKRT